MLKSKKRISITFAYEQPNAFERKFLFVLLNETKHALRCIVHSMNMHRMVSKFQITSLINLAYSQGYTSSAMYDKYAVDA